VRDQGAARPGAAARARADPHPGDRHAAGDPAALPRASLVIPQARRPADLQARVDGRVSSDARPRGNHGWRRPPGRGRHARHVSGQRVGRPRGSLAGDHGGGLEGGGPGDVWRTGHAGARAPQPRAAHVPHLMERPMTIHDSVLELIGDTPLVRLRKLPRPGGATVVAKVESRNPGGSVKDRIALAMIEDAERTGARKPGGTVGEPTSGETGVGTGGTLTGVGEVLKEKMPGILVVAVEPAKSPVLAGGKPRPHGIQGIGASFVPGVLNRAIIDRIVAVKDEDATAWARRLTRE